MKFKRLLYSILFLSLITACSKDDPQPDLLSILSLTLNGATLNTGATGIPLEADLVIVFSATLDPARFETAFSITSTSGSVPATFSYSNQTSKVTIQPELEYQTSYTLRISTGAIGAEGGSLENERILSFTTATDDTIRSLPACTTGNDDCLQTVSLEGSSGTADFQFYSSFPVYEEMAAWENLEVALIVVHGISRNANDYFNYVMNSLQAENLQDRVALIAPRFKIASGANTGEYYWSSTGWREGREAASGEKISSFEVIDLLVQQLSDPQHFPALTDIIVTGHSSGALYTHLYAGANPVEVAYPQLRFHYLVANSQYFYYPDGRRIDGSTSQLYTPSGCTGYDIWPLGYQVVPPYLSTVDQTTFNDRFVNRSITYLLGNGSGPDASLNTTDCSATLLGDTRFERGEHIFQYLELAYPGTHQHQKVIVEGIGHDGQGMYISSTFRAWLLDLID